MSLIRFGTAVRVVRIDPDEYSLVTKRAPMTPIANCARTTPTRLVCTGSNVAFVRALVVAQFLRISHVTSAANPIVKTRVKTTPTIDDRTLRNFSHSERIIELSEMSRLMTYLGGAVLN